jgi:hypothetical protein
MNDNAVMTYCSDTSRADVNLRINAKIRLHITAKTRIKINPYRIEVPKLFDSILTLPLQSPSGWQMILNVKYCQTLDTCFTPSTSVFVEGGK